MSKSSSDAGEKLMKQPSDDLSNAMGQLSVISNETSPSLSEMPIDVVCLILEKCEYKEQLKLRKVSKSLRALVDKLKPACKSIRIDCFKERVTIRINDDTVIYKSGDDDDDGSLWAGYLFETILLREDFKKTAFDDLTFTLKNPKLQLEKFGVSFGFSPEIDEYYNGIQNVLELLDNQLSVKIVDLHVISPSCLLSILPYLKPGVLKKIALIFDYRAVDWRIDLTGMDQIAHLEQWKQAKELELRDPFDTLPMEYATHFNRFKFVERHMDRSRFIRIRNFLSKLDNFEQCTLRSIGYNSLNLVYQLLGEPVSSNTMEKVFHYFIPDSDYYLEFRKATGSIELEITKKKRES